MICAIRPPNECPITTGLRSSVPISSATWSAISPTVLPAITSGCALASATVGGSSGQSAVTAAKPASSNTAAQRSQLLGSSHSPWTKTTGVRPLALALATCSAGDADSAVDMARIYAIRCEG